MAVFSVQAQETTATFTFTDLYGSSTLNSIESQTVDGITISYAKNSAQNAPAFNKDGTLRLYYGSNNGNSATFTAEDGKKITSVVITASSTSYTPDVKYSVDGAAAVSAAWNSTTLTISGINVSTITIQNVGTTQLRTKVIEVTYSASTGGETPDTPVVVAPDAPTLPADCNFDTEMTVEITGVADGATAYYSLNNETDWVEGTSVKITETTTVYAKVVKDELSSEFVSATYTKNVVLEEGMMMITFVTSTSDKSQVATVDNFVNDHIEEHNFETTLTCSATEKCYIGVDGLKMGTKSANGSFTLSLGGSYKVESIVVNAVRYSSDVAVLSVNGAAGQTLTTSLDDYTFEVNSEISQIKVDMTKRGYISSITVICEDGADTPEPVAPNAPILPEEITFKGSMMVEITGIAADATVYYTTDESDPATSATRVEYTEPFEITATTTVKAVAVNEVGASDPATATYTLFVVEETAGYYMKVIAEPADWSGKYLIVYEDGADAYVFNGVDDVNGYVSATTDGDVIKANSEIDAVAVTVAAMEGGYSISTVSGYMYKTAYSNGIDFGETSKAINTFAIAEDGVVITSGNNDDKTTFRFNKASDQKRFRYYKSGQQPVQLYKYVEELPLYQTLTVSEAGWSTLYLGFNARIPSAVEAYTVTTVNDGWVTLTQVTGVLPSNQGVIVKAPAGDYKLFYETTATANVAGNLLEGTLYTDNVDEEAYVLSAPDGVVGLYKAEMNQLEGTAWQNNANKAYLPASAVPNKTAAFYGFEWNGTTGIEGVEAEGAQDGAIYDITGRRVKAITAPGIYIVNGRKVVK